jgi:phosphate transport system substrate-binding protein
MGNFGDDGTPEYYANAGNINSVPDIDVISAYDRNADEYLLFEYLPFNIPRIKTKIAVLENAASLKLSGNLPRLDGATALYPLYSAFVHAVYPDVPFPIPNDDDDYFGKRLGQWPYFPNRLLLIDSYQGYSIVEFASIVQCNRTAAAFQRLIDGETDVVFCYEPSAAEKDAAAKKGVRFNLTPIGKDAFVFLVNSKNSLNNITQQQVRDIYSGRVTNWQSITGADEPVIAYQRPENSGSQTILQAIMKGDAIMKPIIDGEILLPREMFAMLEFVASPYYNYNSAIGYSFLFYVSKMADNSGIKVLSLDGVSPDTQTIQSDRYPFAQTIYAITTGNESENTRKLLDWITGVQGQELVEKTGYIPRRAY